MASGLPDYCRGMDIRFQQLAEVITRPKYGGGHNISGSKPTTGHAGTNLCAITGKGMVYGGTVWLDAALTQANSVVNLVADMKVLSNMSFVRLNEYVITDPGKAVVSINRFDGVNYIYSVGISYGITFEEGLSLLYTEAYGRTPTVHYDLSYALVE